MEERREQSRTKPRQERTGIGEDGAGKERGIIGTAEEMDREGQQQNRTGAGQEHEKTGTKACI